MVLGPILFAVSLSAALPRLQQAAPAGVAAAGQTVFASRCSSCHSIGEGLRVGPDLKGVTERRPREWLARFIADPEKMFEQKDPVALGLLKGSGGLKMPNPGLEPDRIADILAYLGSVTSTTAQAPAPAGQPAGEGSPLSGKKLFAGSVRFKNGGPACESCHAVSSLPFPNGGSLGPDLTGVFAKYGPAALRPLLAALPFPTMLPIFHERLPTADEQRDLEAFLEEAGKMPKPRGAAAAQVLAASAGCAAFLGLSAVIWRRRLGSVRKTLLREMRVPGGRRP